MSLKTYFSDTKGTSVLATVDPQGQPNSAIYSRPHVMNDGTVAFIMANRRTYANIQANPQASYLFVEEGEGWRGKRLGLTRVREEKDPDVIAQFRRKSYPPEEEAKVGDLTMVYFEVNEELPLIGPGPNA